MSNAHGEETSPQALRQANPAQQVSNLKAPENGQIGADPRQRSPERSCSDGNKDGADGGTRTLMTFRPTDFLTYYGFRRHSLLRMQHPASVWGLDYPFVVLRAYLEALDAARLVSTPSPSL